MTELRRELDECKAANQNLAAKWRESQAELVRTNALLLIVEADRDVIKAQRDELVEDVRRLEVEKLS